jgi:tRNA (guanine10-N2)-methyltransferase
MDVSRPCINLRNGPLFDAIVCDPPYGVRARSQKTGIKESKKNKPKKEIKEEDKDEQEPHYSMKEHYEFTHVYSDLLENASKLLKPKGRLVFLFHTDQSLPAERNKFP